MELDRNGLEVLTRDECLRLLGAAELGRVAITSAALPTILPVTFHYDGDQILFRTEWGTKLGAATRNAVVAFEVDEVSPQAHTGWSVVVTGVARELAESDAPLAAPHSPWLRGSADGHVVAISTDIVSGRRVVAT